MPDTLAGIESEYNEVYEKRHKRIEERKAVLLVKEQQVPQINEAFQAVQAGKNIKTLLVPER